MNRAELVTQARRDLDLLVDRLFWAHTDGFYRANPGDQPARPARPRPETADPDHVPGPRHDLGIGNHAARTAWADGVAHLARAEKALVVAALAGTVRQPAPVRPTAASSAPEVRSCADGCQRRLTAILTAAPGREIDRALERATRALDAGCRRLAKLEQGDTVGRAMDVPMCKVCGIRPKEDRKSRCSTCDKWWQRNGFERPRKLDEAELAGALAAKARRAGRGEGWGDEAYSAVVVRDEFVARPWQDGDPTGPKVTGPPERTPLPPREERLAARRRGPR